MTRLLCTGITDNYIRSEEHAKNKAVLVKKSEGRNPPYKLSAWGREIPASTLLYEAKAVISLSV